MVAIHSTFPKGAKIRIVWNDGTQTITKFIEKISNHKMRTSHGDLILTDMRSCNFYKPHPHERVKLNAVMPDIFPNK